MRKGETLTGKAGEGFFVKGISSKMRRDYFGNGVEDEIDIPRP